MKYPLKAAAMAALVFLPAFFPPAALDFKVKVRLAPMARSYQPPSLGRRQGWLAISNRDWFGYTLVVGGGDKLFLHRDNAGAPGVSIPSGTTVTVALNRDNYDLFGSGPGRLRVRIRESRTTTLSLEPFGYVGGTGLLGVVNDGDRVDNGTLFESPPEVVVVRPPVIVAPPRPPPGFNRPPAYRPPPPPPHRPPGRPDGRPGRPGGRDRDDGWNLIFNFGGKKK
ncbi:MAG: hypothetical protein LBU64_04975 [Planctomycetota bacterium]|jgi:hypothetical protein|nr:hypothetical protein [Planctomycetota bacterium]